MLGALMIAPDRLALIADWLREDDFYRKDHRVIYRGICEQSQRGDEVDAVTLGEWFDAQGIADLVGGVKYILELANTTPSAANIVAYAEIVREKAQLRRAIDVGTSLATAAFARGAGSEAVMAVASQELSLLQSSNARTGLQPTKPLIKRLVAEMTRRYAEQGGGLVGLPTPWRALNEHTKGLRDGCVYVVAARPSMGKTAFGLQLAGFTALRGARAAVFEVEMTGDECMARMLACHGEIPFSWVDFPVDGGDSELHWSRLYAMTGQLTNAPLLIDETPALKIEQLMARARREHLREPIRLIVIDHLHDMGVDRTKELRHELGNVVQGCKTLAKELRCPVVLLGQLNRNVAGRQDKRPTLTDLRESGEIEQKADAIYFLHREDYYDRDSHMAGTVELIPAKGRNLRLGETILLRNRFDQMRLEDWDDAYPQPPPAESKQRAPRRSRQAFLDN
ncbi:MAG: replicative DNA helicase [Xanthomonadaceae bacterium]|nr:replicative DNA helicase [Xanthomonadaceae bacterium]